MCGDICIGFIYYILKGKGLLDYTNFIRLLPTFFLTNMKRMIKYL